jgi:NAD(P)-dependent dehydrogenase (short-subunit alcohol dehydrogenase family)
VKRFVAEGARVAVLDVSGPGLTSLERELGSGLLTLEGDVRDPEANAEVVGRAVERFGGLDTFIGNAAVFDGFATVADLDPDVLRAAALELLEINVVGYLLGARASADELKRRHGSLIFTVSNAAFAAGGGGALYTASKHAVVGVVRQLAYELAPAVRVNGVAPGGTLTSLAVTKHLRTIAPIADADQRAASIRSRNALGLALGPEDVVGPYVLLASEEGRAISGTVIRVDAGAGLAGPTLPPSRSAAVAGAQ